MRKCARCNLDRFASRAKNCVTREGGSFGKIKSCSIILRSFLPSPFQVPSDESGDDAPSFQFLLLERSGGGFELTLFSFGSTSSTRLDAREREREERQIKCRKQQQLQAGKMAAKLNVVIPFPLVGVICRLSDATTFGK